jgi:hypothetical protein
MSAIFESIPKSVVPAVNVGHLAFYNVLLSVLVSIYVISAENVDGLFFLFYYKLIELDLNQYPKELLPLLLLFVLY